MIVMAALFIFASACKKEDTPSPGACGAPCNEPDKSDLMINRKGDQKRMQQGDQLPQNVDQGIRPLNGTPAKLLIKPRAGVIPVTNDSTKAIG